MKYEMGNVNFKDGRKLITSTRTGVNKSREDMIDLVQKEANMFAKANKDAKIGIAMHYKNVSHWVPAILSDVTGPVSVWSPYDSNDTAEAYVNDTIDGYQIYVIMKDGNHKDVNYLKPKNGITKGTFK
jgi:hypothetical protein